MLLSKGKDTLKSLSSTLYYYENIARKDTPKRQEEIKAAVTSLRQIVTKINGEVKCKILFLAYELLVLFDY